jgi:hypothetical protein
MHLVITVWALSAAWRWGDWRHWQNYHATMLYMSAMNLLYFYFCADYLLWENKPDLGFSKTFVNLLYTFVVFPCTVLIFLSNYPRNLKMQGFYILKWVIIYIGVELIGALFGRISYQHGWNLGWSSLFVVVMFAMLRLHYKKPIIAYIFSVLIITFLLSYFTDLV